VIGTFSGRERSLKFDIDGKSISTNLRRYEVLEPATATVLARFSNVPDHSPVITINRFQRILHLSGVQCLVHVGLCLSIGLLSLGCKTGCSEVTPKNGDFSRLATIFSEHAWCSSANWAWEAIWQNRDYSGVTSGVTSFCRLSTRRARQCK
jgi:hypothetical protein